jgi:hypothetical protein
MFSDVRRYTVKYPGMIADESACGEAPLALASGVTALGRPPGDQGERPVEAISAQGSVGTSLESAYPRCLS